MIFRFSINIVLNMLLLLFFSLPITLLSMGLFSPLEDIFHIGPHVITRVISFSKPWWRYYVIVEYGLN